MKCLVENDFLLRKKPHTHKWWGGQVVDKHITTIKESFLSAANVLNALSAVNGLSAGYTLASSFFFKTSAKNHSKGILLSLKKIRKSYDLQHCARGISQTQK